MKKISLFCFILLSYAASGVCAESGLTALVGSSLQQLQVAKGSGDLAALTNANYVRLRGQTTEKYVDEIAAATGCSVGKGNMLFFNERPHNVILVALGNKKTFQSIVLRYEGEAWTSGPLSLRGEDMEKADYFWKAVQGVGGKQSFHVISILGAWMLGVPYDYLKSAELHSHICPGLFFGYIMAKGVEANMPLREYENYIYIGSPNECKEDAMQVVLGVTGGKRTMFIKKLAQNQLVEIPGRVITGIVVRWSKMENKGTGLVVSIDLDAIKKVTKVGKEMPANLKLLAARKLNGRLTETEMFFRIEKEFQVDKELKEKLVMAGVNPYELLAMTPVVPKK